MYYEYNKREGGRRGLNSHHLVFLGSVLAGLVAATTGCFLTSTFLGSTFLGSSFLSTETLLIFLSLLSVLRLLAKASKTFLYSSVRARVFFHLLTLSSFWILFLLSLDSVTSLWILGALCLVISGFLALLKVLLIACFLMRAHEDWVVFSPSAFSIPQSLRMPLALLGPRRLFLVSSVSPGISFSPFLMRVRERVLMSGPTMHPRTDLLFLSPLRLARYPDVPGARSNLILLLQKTPCFMAKPSLSKPPLILKMQPLNYYPSVSASTSWPIRFSKKTRHRLSSSMSKDLVVPLVGQEMLNYVAEEVPSSLITQQYILFQIIIQGIGFPQGEVE